MRDIMCSGYVAGGNCRWFGAKADSKNVTNNVLTGPVEDSDVQAAINKRLSFEDDASGEYASMLAFAAPLSDAASESRDQVISITDRLLPWEVSSNAAPQKTYFPGGKNGYDTYKQKWQLNQIHFGEDVRASESMAFMSQVRVGALPCPRAPRAPPPCLGVTRATCDSYDPRERRFCVCVCVCNCCAARAPSTTTFAFSARRVGTIRGRPTFSSSSPARGTLAPTPSQGYALSHQLTHLWPSHVSRVPCCARLTSWQDARWRRGESVSLKAARDGMVSLEVAAHSQLVFGKKSA